MSGANDDEIRKLAEKLATLLDVEKSEEVHVFDADEVKALQRVLRFVERLDALGWWGKWLFYAVVTAGAIIANWDRILGMFRGGQ